MGGKTSKNLSKIKPHVEPLEGWFKSSDVAQKLGLTVNVVGRALHELHNDGLLRRKAAGGGKFEWRVKGNK